MGGWALGAQGRAATPWRNKLRVRTPCTRTSLAPGLPAYPSWLPTLGLLEAPGLPPLVLTDYCFEALVRSQVRMCASRPWQPWCMAEPHFPL